MKISSFRSFFFHTTTLVSYFFTIYFLFYHTGLVAAGIAIAVFYASLHFSMIERKHTLRLYHFLLLLLVACVLWIILLGTNDIYLIFSLLLYHTGIFFLARYILSALQNRVFLSTWEIVHIGGYIFTVFMTLCFGTLILATYPSFPFTCDDIQQNSDAVIETLSRPFALGREKLQEMKNDFTSTSRLSVGEALGVSFAPSLENAYDSDTSAPAISIDFVPSLQQSIASGSDLSFTGAVLSGSATGLSGGLATMDPTTTGGIIGFIDTYKTRLVDQVIADNTTINLTTCEFLVGEITDKYNKPVFQFSLVLLLFILFYPFFRMIVFVVEVCSWILLLFLMATGIYKKVLIVEQTEDLV